ncbi:ABC transporter substrate-binding protein [Maledivibacter halophilus]|uniref:Amino acid/amide ABC transporter substrate-binding protein, HAAT family n=1 Tax=Maledivibacter halophilus TaxID=36842 RepID=A0A1T5M9F6_9FIRM|nr:ABC transporter substrate-binding protein [Maledivibacter halophilus]SKC84870.1 amino acid/amide ABC transporter substrate-binding protein, HAAT family [Maledivibacter halophilus]
MKRTISILIVIMLIMTTFTGCGQKSGSSKDSEVVKIAVVGPLTGDFAEYGTGFKNAVELMVEQWNEDGGVIGKKIEVVAFDDKNSGEEAASIAEKIASDKDIVGVVGHFASGVCMAASPTYQEVGIVEVSPSASHPDYTKEGDFIFRNNTVIDVESGVAVDLATKTIGKKKVGILSVKTDWGTNTAAITKELVEEAGGTVVDHQEVVDGTIDFSPNVSKLKDAGAEVVIVAAMYNILAPFASQYKAVNPDIELVGFSNAYSQQLINLAKENAENIHFPTIFFHGSEDEAVSSFVKIYEEKYGSIPSSLTAQAYDSTGILLAAIETANKVDRAAVKDELYKMTYPGVTGETKFDENGDAIKVFTNVKVENGKFVEVK